MFTYYYIGEYMLILEVHYNKANNQKYVTIPKSRDIQPGDYVRIIKIGSPDIDGVVEPCQS